MNTVAAVIPSRQAGDILAGMWALICGFGRISKPLVWEREAAIGGTGKLSTAAVGFADTFWPPGSCARLRRTHVIHGLCSVSLQ